MDNVSLLQEKGITPFFVPPYSPDFSAIELAFSKCKRAYRSMWHTDVSTLDKANYVFTDQVLSATDIRNMFNHTIDTIFSTTDKHLKT